MIINNLFSIFRNTNTKKKKKKTLSLSLIIEFLLMANDIDIWKAW